MNFKKNKIKKVFNLMGVLNIKYKTQNKKFPKKINNKISNQLLINFIYLNTNSEKKSGLKNGFYFINSSNFFNAGFGVNKACVTFKKNRITKLLTISAVVFNPNGKNFTQNKIINKHSILKVIFSPSNVRIGMNKTELNLYALVTNTPERDGQVNAVILENLNL